MRMSYPSSFDAELQALLESDARAVQERHDQPHRAVNLPHELGEFFPTEHDRQLVRHPCPRHMLHGTR